MEAAWAHPGRPARAAPLPGPWATHSATPGPSGTLPRQSPSAPEYSQSPGRASAVGFGSLMAAAPGEAGRRQRRGAVHASWAPTGATVTRPPASSQRSSHLAQEGTAGPAAPNPGSLEASPAPQVQAGTMRGPARFATSERAAAAQGLATVFHRWAGVPAGAAPGLGAGCGGVGLGAGSAETLGQARCWLVTGEPLGPRTPRSRPHGSVPLCVCSARVRVCWGAQVWRKAGGTAPGGAAWSSEASGRGPRSPHGAGAGTPASGLPQLKRALDL